MVLGADLDSTNYNLRFKFPVQFQFVASDTTNPLLNINHDYNGVGLLLDTDGTTADSFQWIADTTTGVVGDWDWDSLTTGDGLNISMSALTTGNGITIAATNTTGNTINLVPSAMTTGSGLNILAASADTGAWDCIHVKIDHVDAVNAIGIISENDSTGAAFQALSNAAGAVGAVIELNQQSASAADNDVAGRIIFKADDEETTPTNTTIGQIDVLWIDATAVSYGSEFQFTTSTSAAANLAVRIDHVGQIHADLGGGAGSVTVFDEHDDIGINALLDETEASQVLWLGEMERIGVVSRKTPEQGGSGFMWNLQKADLFALGAIGQLNDKVDANYDEVRGMVAGMEAEIARLQAGTTDVLTGGV
jgi:hypothetical protein